MKTVKFYALLGTVLVALLFAGCSKDKDEDIVPNTPTTNLNEAEKAGLLEMVEIEKLHHDVYLTMSENNQCEIFDELCSCNKNFMDQLSEKVDKYKLENPITEREAGIYADQDFQAKYNEFLLISDGRLQEFLAFAKQMEEYGLIDMEVRLAQVDGNEDLAEIYTEIIEETKCQLEIIINKIDHRDPVEHSGNPPDDF